MSTQEAQQQRSFSLSLSAETVVIDGQNYVIREMKASAREKYLDSMRSFISQDAGGNAVAVKKFEGLQSNLLARCLCTQDGALVPETTIQEWPSGVVGELFAIAQQVNHLKQEAAPEKKA